MIRIISGTLKNKILKCPKNIRPTKDIVRESVFNILTAKGINFEKSSIIDMCSGSGSYGIEALSRGAQKVTFIEKSPLNSDIIKNNLNILNQSKYEIIVKDIIKIKTPFPMYTVSFLDPPYQEKILYEKGLELLKESKNIIVELDIHSQEALKEIISKNLPSHVIKTEKKYGQTLIFLIEKNL